jgi:uroporphyrinogen-III synthase
MVCRLPEGHCAGNTKGMAGQSQVLRTPVPHVLLTRPLEQSQRFARQLRAAFGGPVQIMITPLMAPAFMTPALPEGPLQGLIFSSETGVAAYARLPNPPRAAVWCVGKRTAKIAQSAGLETVCVAPDVATLTRQIIALRPTGGLLHLRGQDSTGNLAQTLTEAGIRTAEAVLYNQHAIPLAQRAIRLLQGQQAVVVPVFSARSMRLLCDAAQHAAAPLRLVALSDAVASAAPAQLQARITTCAKPDADSMAKSVISLLREPALP